METRRRWGPGRWGLPTAARGRGKRPSPESGFVIMTIQVTGCYSRSDLSNPYTSRMEMSFAESVL